MAGEALFHTLVEEEYYRSVQLVMNSFVLCNALYLI